MWARAAAAAAPRRGCRRNRSVGNSDLAVGRIHHQTRRNRAPELAAATPVKEPSARRPADRGRAGKAVSWTVVATTGWPCDKCFAAPSHSRILYEQEMLLEIQSGRTRAGEPGSESTEFARRWAAGTSTAGASRSPAPGPPPISCGGGGDGGGGLASGDHLPSAGSSPPGPVSVASRRRNLAAWPFFIPTAATSSASSCVRAGGRRRGSERERKGTHAAPPQRGQQGTRRGPCACSPRGSSGPSSNVVHRQHGVSAAMMQAAGRGARAR